MCPCTPSPEPRPSAGSWWRLHLPFVVSLFLVLTRQPHDPGPPCGWPACSRVAGCCERARDPRARTFAINKLKWKTEIKIYNAQTPKSHAKKEGASRKRPHKAGSGASWGCAAAQLARAHNTSAAVFTGNFPTKNNGGAEDPARRVKAHPQDVGPFFRRYSISRNTGIEQNKPWLPIPVPAEANPGGLAWWLDALAARN